MLTTDVLTAKNIGILETFVVPQGLDVYNPSRPFGYKGKEIIAARVEPSEDELNSVVMFFTKNELSEWQKLNDLPEYAMQDPFITKINGRIVFGGVEVTVEEGRAVDYTTVLYLGDNLEEMKLLYKGPERMKGIRIVQLQNGKIALFTRPQVVSEKDPYGRGRIAFALIDSLDQINEGVKCAEIIPGLYKDEEWGGTNEIYELDNGNIGVLGHHANYDEENKKHYYSIAFEFDPNLRKIVQYKVVVKREAFPMSVRAKKEDLFDVLYTGGLKKQIDSEKYRLYVGISDTAVGSIEIEPPFSSNPKLNMQII